MANANQKTLLIDTAFEEIKHICIIFQKLLLLQILKLKIFKTNYESMGRKKNKKQILDSIKF